MKRSPQLTAVLLTFLTVSVPAFANHVHLQVAWRANALELEVYDFEAGAFPAEANPFVIGNAGMNLIPSAPAFAYLGEAGATFFALPQDGHPSLPYLGIGMDNAPAGTFAGNQVNLRLVSVHGPGHFALYQVNAFGQPTLQMNSRDGIAPDSDRIVLAPGAHEHQNWAFSAPGEYQVTVIADAVRQSTGQPVASDPATYRFQVLPPPAARLELTRDAGNDFNLVVQSRVGARLQVIESADLASWTTNAPTLLTAPIWQTVVPAAGGHRYWRVEEVFP
jgi:surface-anchored protein